MNENKTKNMLFEKLYNSTVRIKKLDVIKNLNKFQTTQFYNEEELISLQKKKLQSILYIANNNVPYYKGKIKGAINATPSIDQFPFITKKEVSQNLDAFYSLKNRGSLYKKTTGGSTGEALTVLKDACALSNSMAAAWRGYGWAGVGIGCKQARFWGIPITNKDKIKMYITDFIAHRKRFSAFAFTEKDLHLYTRQLKKFQPDYFYGYVSMLNQYADYLIKNKIEFPIKLKSIITTAEVLSDKIREKLQDVFRVRVYNEYGCGEFGTIAHECEYGNLHVNEENVLIEIYDYENKCKDGDVGEIVVTELNNHAMPLIKYRLGDYAAIIRKKCKCGRELKIIDKLYGRAYDIIKNREGKLFHGEFFMYIFEEAKRKGLGISAFQVIQKDYDSFIVKIVPEQGFSEASEHYIKNYFQENYSASVKIAFEKVLKIERAKSGKMRVVIGKNDL